MLRTCRPLILSMATWPTCEGLLRWGEASRAMGFEGMGCMHPMQIEIIHRAFAPTASELEKALKIVAAFEEAQARGLGVVSLGSKMIDAPVVQRARSWWRGRSRWDCCVIQFEVTDAIRVQNDCNELACADTLTELVTELQLGTRACPD